MTLAEHRGIKGPTGGDDAAQEAAAARGAHAGPAEYVKIGVVLAIATAVELAVLYSDVAQWALVAALMVLSVMKLSLVALWFMHLRFDSRLFSGLLVGGLMLAVVLFVVVLATLGGGLV